jgi:hypothetical protein
MIILKNIAGCSKDNFSRMQWQNETKGRITHSTLTSQFLAGISTEIKKLMAYTLEISK